MVSESTSGKTLKLHNPTSQGSNLQEDLHNVISMMGPPTPSHQLYTPREASEDIETSNCTQSTRKTDTSSNTSFVEVVIKNHHKSKKGNLIREINTCKSICTNTAAQTEHCQASQKQPESSESSLSMGGPADTTESTNGPGILPNPSFMPMQVQCPHSMCPQAICPSAGYTSKNVKYENIDNRCTDWFSRKKSQWSTKMQDRGVYRETNDHNKNSGDSINYNTKKPENNIKPEPYRNLHGGQGYIKKTELYYFDHGNAAYYNTTDSPPSILADYLAEKTENASTRFWAQIFGVANLGVALVTTFILQLIRFILFSIVRPLTVGLIQLFSDYFLKPFLSVLFNALIQPPLIFLFNIMTSLRDLCGPVANAMGFFLKEIAVVFRAFRLVESNHSKNPCPA